MVKPGIWPTKEKNFVQTVRGRDFSNKSHGATCRIK